MAAGKCPHCGALVTSIKANEVPVKVNGVDTYRGVTFACGRCNAVLTATIDPIAIKSDTIKKLSAK